jgi:hypothetical protein
VHANRALIHYILPVIIAQLAFTGAQIYIHHIQAGYAFATAQTTYLYNKQNIIKLQLSFIIK